MLFISGQIPLDPGTSKPAGKDIETQTRQVFANIKAILQEAGYTLVDYFPLPHQSWWTDYYTPLITVLRHIRTKYPNNDTAERICAEFEHEMEMHRKYADWYGYGFFIMKKR